MRAKLAKYEGQRRKFRATFERYGEKTWQNHIKRTILFLNVIDISSSQTVTDHLWFTLGKGFESMSLKQGDAVTFLAKVDTYEKGYVHGEDDFRELDYRLVFPTQLQKLAVEPGQTVLNL